MFEDTGNRQDRRQGVHLIAIILLFGSIWGLLEATLGGFLHMIIFPNKGAIMSSIGIAIMASALAIYKKPAMTLGIGIVAASFKLLDVLIFALPITSIHIINPAMAIIFESLAFSLVVTFIMDKIARNSSSRIGAVVLAGLISATAWGYFAIYVMNAPAYARVVFTAREFITNQGVVQAAFFGISLPLGYLMGERLAKITFPALVPQPLYYAVSITVVCLCWGASAIAKLSGL